MGNFWWRMSKSVTILHKLEKMLQCKKRVHKFHEMSCTQNVCSKTTHLMNSFAIFSTYSLDCFLIVRLPKSSRNISVFSVKKLNQNNEIFYFWLMKGFHQFWKDYLFITVSFLYCGNRNTKNIDFNLILLRFHQVLIHVFG